MVDWRVAEALVAAVRATDRHISITEVACQAAEQGLSPNDVDRPNGADALTAIALAVRPGTDRWFTEPSTWRGAVSAALSLVDTAAETAAQRRAAYWRAQVRARRLAAQPRQR